MYQRAIVPRRSIFKDFVYQINHILEGDCTQDFSILWEEIVSCRQDREISSEEYNYLQFLLDGYV